MKLLLRSILLLAFFFLNGYSSEAVSLKNNIENTVSIHQKLLPASSLHQNIIDSQDLPGHSRNTFRKTRGIKEEDDENEAKFVCLKKAKSAGADAAGFITYLLPVNDSFQKDYYSDHISRSGIPYVSYLIASPNKLYRLFQVFRI